MTRRSFRFPTIADLVLVVALLLAACAPKFDWREVHGAEAPFEVLMPAKPDRLSQPVNLDGQSTTMTMTAAEIDGVTFAVGTAALADAQAARRALDAMKTAMVRNIGGRIDREKTSAAGPAGGAQTVIDIEATGAPGPRTGGKPRMLAARFIARDARVYQAVVIGPRGTVPAEAIDTFLASFKVR